MLSSYAIPAQDITTTTTPAAGANNGGGSGSAQNASSPPRNLNLILNPQYGVTAAAEAFNGGATTIASQIESQQQQDELLANVVSSSSDAILSAADCCNERTRLLGGGGVGVQPQRPRRQIHINNPHNFSNNNNNNTSASSGPKSVGLKRVSFGSSKGSMVETLVFETPTPLSEHVEPPFGFDGDFGDKTPTNCNIYSRVNTDDSGIEIQEESERSIVRVSIYQSSQPQQICPPEYITRFEDNLDNSFSNYNYNLEDIMTAASTIPGYDRQQSTDSGWDNPFRPGGDLSREADEIVNMIRGGKPITPTEDHALGNGNAQREDNCNGTAAAENVTKTNITQTQSAQNGTNSHRVQSTATTTATAAAAGATKPSENNGVTSLAQVSKQVVPGPTSASHVVIDEKKNKKKGCCVVQ